MLSHCSAKVFSKIFNLRRSAAVEQELLRVGHGQVSGNILIRTSLLEEVSAA